MNATGTTPQPRRSRTIIMSSLDAFRHESIRGRLYGGVDECLNVSWAALVVLELACPLRYSRAMLKINVSHYLKTYLHLRLAVVCGAANRDSMDDPWRTGFTALPALHLVKVCNRRSRHQGARTRMDRALEMKPQKIRWFSDHGAGVCPEPTTPPLRCLAFGDCVCIVPLHGERQCDMIKAHAPAR